MNIDSYVNPLLPVFFKLNLNSVIIKDARTVFFIISRSISVKFELFSPFIVASSYAQNEACRVPLNKAVKSVA